MAVESCYLPGKLLGEGRFRVVEARHRDKDERVAVKLSDDPTSRDAALETLLQEAKFHMSLNLPYIVKLREVFESASQVALVMDILEGGNGSSLVEGLPECRAAGLLLQALSALQHHEVGMVHRDVKPENLVFADEERTQLVLVNFGFAQHARDSPREVLACASRPGTVVYMSEVYRYEVHDSKAHMWSLLASPLLFS